MAPIRRLEGEGQFSTILAAQLALHNSGAQQCDSMASNHETLNAKQKKKSFARRGKKVRKIKYKVLDTIAGKEFGILLSDSQIARMIKRKAYFLSSKDDSKGVKRIRTAKWPAVVAEFKLQVPDNWDPPPPVILLQAAEWAEELSRFLQEQLASFDAGSQSRFQIIYVDRVNRLLVLSMISGR